MTKLKLGSLLDDKPVSSALNYPHLFIAISLPTRGARRETGQSIAEPQS